VASGVNKELNLVQRMRFSVSRFSALSTIVV